MRVTQKGNAVKGISYRDRDYAFGEAMLALRAKIGLTQVELTQFLGVSRRTVGDWEAGNSYPKPEHLKQLVVLSLQHQAFPTGSEAERIRALWHASHQKVLWDEAWLNELLTPSPERTTGLTRDLEPGHEESPTKSEKHASLILPFQPTAFVGRVTELAEIDSLLGNPACRLLTLVGPGGIGKTRLAIEVATHQTEKFQDGVVFVDLALVSTPNNIVSAIGASLKLSFSGQTNPREHLLEYLQKRHTLLLLDNFEHLLEGVELVSEILVGAPHVSILVTSRERLNLSAEWLFDVGGLSYPLGDQRSLSASKDLAEYSAVQLFIQRAIQVQSVFPLSDATLARIVSICQHVDGMPLAVGFALNNLAQAAYLEDDLKQAFAFASESVSPYRAQKADTKLAEVLVTLGRILHAQGDLTAAQETLTEALQLAFVVGPRLTVVTGLEALAGVTIEQGKVILSIHMLSVVSTLRAQMSTPLRPIDQAPFEQALESARSKIAPEDFSAAWSEAERLPLEQIMRIIDWSAQPR